MDRMETCHATGTGHVSMCTWGGEGGFEAKQAYLSSPETSGRRPSHGDVEARRREPCHPPTSPMGSLKVKIQASAGGAGDACDWM